MKVLGLTGLPGSGKSEVGKVGSEYGALVVRMGDMVWDHLRTMGLPLESRMVGKIAHEQRLTEGPDIWARKTVEHIETNFLVKNVFPEMIIIDGLRSIEESDYFRKEFPDFRTVAVHSSQKTRYERIMARKREDDTVTFQAFQDREKRELSWGIAQVIALSDIMLVNEGNLEELKASIVVNILGDG